MKVFLTGASGILGSDISSAFENEGHTVLGFNSGNIDLRDLSSLKKNVANFKPDLIIHAAAMTNVDLCETEKVEAYSINVTGTKNLAIAALENNSRFVYISSCGVYGNSKKTPYNENDQTEPLNYHHLTKLKGEEEVRKILPDHIIIRPGWLFGGTPQHKKNFVEARRKEALEGNEIKSAVDKFGSPTYTKDVAKQLLVLINNNHQGIYNVVNEGTASRFEYVSEIIRLFNFKNKMTGVSSDSFPRKANMPDNEMLENMNLKLEGFNIMRLWKDALKEYIEETFNGLTV